MKEIRKETEINASPEQVWNVLTDFESFPEWNPFIKSASGKAEVGAKLKAYLKPPKGMGMTFKPRVLVAESGREFRWLGRFLLPGIFDGEHYFLIETVADDRVRFIQGERFRGILVPFFGSVINNAAQGFEEMNEALKKRVEQGES